MEPLNDFEKVLLSSSSLEEEQLLDLKVIFAGISFGKQRVATAKQVVHTLSLLGFSLTPEPDGTVCLAEGENLSVLTEQEFLQCAVKAADAASYSEEAKKARFTQGLFRMIAPRHQKELTPSMVREFMANSDCEEISIADAERFCRAISRQGAEHITSMDLMRWVQSEKQRTNQVRAPVAAPRR